MGHTFARDQGRARLRHDFGADGTFGGHRAYLSKALARRGLAMSEIPGLRESLG